MNLVVLGRLFKFGEASGTLPATYDQKLEHVLRRATAVFAEKGYHRASIRDIARATGMSLAGLYYYFTSKQQLLFLIADHSHTGMLENCLAALEGATGPRDKLARLIRAHLEFALADMDRIKVLSHEIGSLHGEYLAKVVEKRKRYFATLVGILRELRGNGAGNGRDLRTAAAGLFGMLNWIYTWYKPGRDPDAATLAEQMARIFLDGFTGRAARATRLQPSYSRGPLAPAPPPPPSRPGSPSSRAPAWRSSGRRDREGAMAALRRGGVQYVNREE